MSYVARAMLYGQYLEAHFACWILCYGYVQSGKMLLSLMESCLEMESLVAWHVMYPQLLAWL